MRTVLIAVVLAVAIACPLAISQTITTAALPRAIPNPTPNYSYQMQSSAPCGGPGWTATGVPTGFVLDTSGLLHGNSNTPFGPTSITFHCGSDVKPLNLWNKPNRTVEWPHTVKIATVPYVWLPYTPEWMRNNTDVAISGNPDLSGPTEVYPLTQAYEDGGGWYPGLITLYLIDIATARGWADYERAILHQTTDYQPPGYSNGAYWIGMDAFDIFDQPVDWENSGISHVNRIRNGVLLYHGSTYQDISYPIYAATAGPYTIANNDTLYIGYQEPFDEMKFTVTTARIAGTLLWEYWNGSVWTTLTLDQADGTNGLTQSGTILFTPPVDWARNSVNSSHTKFWVRVTPSATTTAPRVSQLKGDDWMANHSGCTLNGNPVTCVMRGWNAGDSHVITVAGAYKYNPTPPSNATARFQYQGRASGYWNPNYIFIVPGRADATTGDIMPGVAKAAEAHDLMAHRVSNGPIVNGVIFDNIGTLPYWLPSPDVTAVDFSNGWAPQFTSLVAAIHITDPNAKIGENLDASMPGAQGIMDATYISLAENSFYSLTLNSQQYFYESQFNQVATGNHKRIFAGWDTPHWQTYYDPCGYNGQDSCKTYTHWQQGDRSPMQTLGGYLMVMNSNSVFEYDMGGWYYNFVDEVLVWDAATTTLAEALPHNLNISSSTLHVVNGSGFVNNGIYYNYVLQVGTDVLTTTRGVDANHYATPDPNTAATYITQDWPVGTVVKFARVKHLSTDPVPDYHTVAMWLAYFPAESLDYGAPDVAGFNGGRHGVWYTGQQVGQGPTCATVGKCSPVSRRDFTKALVIQRAMGPFDPSDADVPSSPITLPTCTSCQWQRVHADGTLDSPTTTVTLMGNETAVYLKASSLPTVNDPVPAPPPGSYSGTQTISLTVPTTPPPVTICWNDYTAVPSCDSSAVCVNSNTYSSPLGFATTHDLRVIACKVGYNPSNVVGGLYLLDNKPNISYYSIPGGTYATPQLVTIGTFWQGPPAAIICYTIDGTTPISDMLGLSCTHGTKYTTPVNVDHSLRLESIVGAAGLTDTTPTTADYTITGSDLRVTTLTLPDGVKDMVYPPQTLTAAGGTAPYTWAISAGTLPTGLTLTGAVISGTPTVTGKSDFTVQVTDSTVPTPNVATADLSITIAASALTITSTSPLPSGTVSTAYQFVFAATGGVPPYTWVSVSGGNGPIPGLTLDSSGLLAGTPTKEGSYSLMVIVRDSGGSNKSKAFAITINPINKVADPTINPQAGLYNNDPAPTLTTTEQLAVICYRLDGVDPTAPVFGTCGSGSTTLANGGTVHITTTGTRLKALATLAGKDNSNIVSAIYTLQVAPVSAVPETGLYADPQTVTLSSATTGEISKYCVDTDNTCDPLTGTTYTEPVVISSTSYLRRVGVKTGYGNSAVSSDLYTIESGVGRPHLSGVYINKGGKVK